MKVVLLHDWLTGFRGGERVFEVFCELFPNAPIYTLIYEKGSVSSKIESHSIHSSFLNQLPGVKNYYRKLLPLFPLAASSIKIHEEADLVLSSSHCVIKGVHKPFGAKHISYIHSPMRYIYDQFDNYFGPGKPPLERLVAHLIRPFLTGWDKLSNDNVDYFISNSKFVQNRIDHFYNKQSQIIYPFVDLDDFKFLKDKKREKENYYLMVSAFAPNKRVDLAVETFNINGKKLKIVGGGQEAQKLKKMAKSNIEFLGNVERSAVIELMVSARGFVFPGIEDFGITPLESLAAGTAVIAFKAGGVLETLDENVAQFFDEASVESLSEAIVRFEQKNFNLEDLLKKANLFSKDRFKKDIQNVIQRVLSSKKTF